MPNDETNIPKQDQGQKSIRHPFVINVDIEAMLEKIDSCDKNLAKYCT